MAAPATESECSGDDSSNKPTIASLSYSMRSRFCLDENEMRKRPTLTGIVLVIASGSVLLPGCVRRRMTVRTNPSGAMVYVDHQSVGTTPVSTSFTYYGTRQIEIIKDGYRTEKFLRRFNPPWYEWPGLDFVSETLWPFEKRDERIIDVQLSPDINVPTDALIRSGEELRSQASKGIVVGPPPSVGGPTSAESVVPYGGTPAINTLPSNQGFNVPSFPGSLPTTPGPNGFGSPNTPGAFSPFFDVPPASMPASNVAPGASYRPELVKP